MPTHMDPRVQAVPAQPQFPPAGFIGGQQVPHHLAPDNVPAPELPDPAGSWQTPVDDDEPGDYGDYFGFDLRYQYLLPDGRQWIEFRVLNEGNIAEYQRILNRDVMVEKTTGNARIRINQVEERHALLQVAVTGWHMVRRQRDRIAEVPFSNGTPGSTFMQWLKVADPRIVADLEEQVRKQNPFLLAANNETLEAIDKQIEDLMTQRRVIEERMRGEAGFATS